LLPVFKPSTEASDREWRHAATRDKHCYDGDDPDFSIVPAVTASATEMIALRIAENMREVLGSCDRLADWVEKICTTPGQVRLNYDGWFVFWVRDAKTSKAYVLVELPGLYPAQAAVPVRRELARRVDKAIGPDGREDVAAHVIDVAQALVKAR
jgi:hypothetical protein